RVTTGPARRRLSIQGDLHLVRGDPRRVAQEVQQDVIDRDLLETRLAEISADVLFRRSTWFAEVKGKEAVQRRVVLVSLPYLVRGRGVLVAGGNVKAHKLTGFDLLQKVTYLILGYVVLIREA